MAVSAVVNGGYLYEPMIVKRIVDDKNTIYEERNTKFKRRVISSNTSAIMRDALEVLSLKEEDEVLILMDIELVVKLVLLKNKKTEFI